MLSLFRIIGFLQWLQYELLHLSLEVAAENSWVVVNNFRDILFGKRYVDSYLAHNRRNEGLYDISISSQFSEKEAGKEEFIGMLVAFTEMI